MAATQCELIDVRLREFFDNPAVEDLARPGLCG